MIHSISTPEIKPGISREQDECLPLRWGAGSSLLTSLAIYFSTFNNVGFWFLEGVSETGLILSFTFWIQNGANCILHKRHLCWKCRTTNVGQQFFVYIWLSVCTNKSYNVVLFCKHLLHNRKIGAYQNQNILTSLNNISSNMVCTRTPDSRFFFVQSSSKTKNCWAKLLSVGFPTHLWTKYRV